MTFLASTFAASVLKTTNDMPERKRLEKKHHTQSKQVDNIKETLNKVNEKQKDILRLKKLHAQVKNNHMKNKKKNHVHEKKRHENDEEHNKSHHKDRDRSCHRTHCKNSHSKSCEGESNKEEHKRPCRTHHNDGQSKSREGKSNKNDHSKSHETLHKDDHLKCRKEESNKDNSSRNHQREFNKDQTQMPSKKNHRADSNSNSNSKSKCQHLTCDNSNPNEKNALRVKEPNKSDDQNKTCEKERGRSRTRSRKCSKKNSKSYSRSSLKSSHSSSSSKSLSSRSSSKCSSQCCQSRSLSQCCQSRSSSKSYRSRSSSKSSSSRCSSKSSHSRSSSKSSHSRSSSKSSHSRSSSSSSRSTSSLSVCSNDEQFMKDLGKIQELDKNKHHDHKHEDKYTHKDKNKNENNDKHKDEHKHDDHHKNKHCEHKHEHKHAHKDEHKHEDHNEHKHDDDNESDNKHHVPSDNPDCGCKNKPAADLFEMVPYNDSPLPLTHGNVFYYTYPFNDYGTDNKLSINIITYVTFEHVKHHFHKSVLQLCEVYDYENRVKQILSNPYLKNSHGIALSKKSTVYLSIFKEAAGFDNSFGYYLFDDSNLITDPNNSQQTILNLSSIQQVVVYPCIKRMANRVARIGTFEPSHNSTNFGIGFFICADGNNKQLVNGDLVRNFPEYNYYTHYEINQIDSPPQYRFRHKFIEQSTSCLCYQNVKNYFIMFEDLSMPVYSNSGAIIDDSQLSFNNAILVVSVVEHEGSYNSSLLMP
jgi:hypothetical protein